MPKIQTYDAPQVQNQPIPNVSQGPMSTPAAFGGPAGQGLANLGNDIATIQADIKRQDDVAAVKQAQLDFEKGVDDINWTSEDAFFKRQGEAGYKTYGDTLKQIEKLRKGVLERLTPDQASQFDLTSQAFAQKESVAMGRHAHESRKKYLDDQDIAIATQAVASGALRYEGDEPLVYESRIANAAANLQDRNGWSAEQRDAWILEQTSKLHVNAIDNMLEQGKSAEQVNAYFDKYSERIDGSFHDDVKKKISAETDRTRYQNITDELVVAYPSEEEGLAHIRKEYKGQDRDSLVTRYKARMGEKRHKEQVAVDDAYRDAIHTIWNGGGIENIPEGTADLLKRKGKWNSLEGEQMQMMTGVSQHDDGVWLMNNFYNLPPDERLAMDEEELKKHMSYDTYAAFVEQKAKGGEYGPTRTENDIIASRLTSFGIDINDDKNESNRERVNEFYTAFDTAIAEFTDDKKRAPNKFERIEIINRLTTQEDLMKYDSWFFGMDRVGDPGGNGAARFQTRSPENISAVSELLGIPEDDLESALDVLDLGEETVDQKNVRKAMRNIVTPANAIGIPPEDYVRTVADLVEIGMPVTAENIKLIHKLGQRQ